MSSKNLLRTTVAAAAVLIMAPAVMAQEAQPETARTNEAVQVRTREQARVHADGVQQQAAGQVQRDAQAQRAGQAQRDGQAQRARMQQQSRNQAAQNAQRDATRGQAQNMSRSGARDAARARSMTRTRSRIHRTSP